MSIKDMMVRLFIYRQSTKRIRSKLHQIIQSSRRLQTVCNVVLDAHHAMVIDHGNARTRNSVSELSNVATAGPTATTVLTSVTVSTLAATDWASEASSSQSSTINASMVDQFTTGFIHFFDHKCNTHLAHRQTSTFHSHTTIQLGIWVHHLAKTLPMFWPSLPRFAPIKSRSHGTSGTSTVAWSPAASQPVWTMLPSPLTSNAHVTRTLVWTAPNVPMTGTTSNASVAPDTMAPGASRVSTQCRNTCFAVTKSLVLDSVDSRLWRH